MYFRMLASSDKPMEDNTGITSFSNSDANLLASLQRSTYITIDLITGNSFIKMVFCLLMVLHIRQNSGKRLLSIWENGVRMKDTIHNDKKPKRKGTPLGGAFPLSKKSETLINLVRKYYKFGWSPQTIPFRFGLRFPSLS